MDYKILKVRLDLTKDNRLPVKPVQGESAVKIEFTLIHNSQPFPLTGTTVNVKFRKKDGTISLLPGVITNATAGIAEVKLTNQVLLFAGTVVGIVEVVGEAGVAKSFIFIMEVQPGVDDPNTESVDEYPALDQAFMDIQSIRNDFDAIVAGLTVDSEVILARGGKTTLKERLDESDMQLNEKLQKLKTENLIRNGDMTNGLLYWNSIDQVSVSGKTLSIIGTGANTYPSANNSGGKNAIYGHKYYRKVKMRVTNSECILIRIRNFDFSTTDKAITNPIQNVWYELSDVITALNNVLIRPYITHTYATAEIANGKKAEVEYLITIDLTETFGEGNEPSKEQMDRLLSEFPNSWFDGTQEIFPLKNIPQLLDDKANKTQEAWIPLTLINGASVGSGLTVACYKDTLGVVRYKGRIVVATGGVAQINIPVGYRLTETKYFTIPRVDSATVVNRADVSTQIVIYSAGTYDLSGISYKAEA